MKAVFPLRKFQIEALKAFNKPLYDDSHVICVAPTGSGKSLIYERLVGDSNRRTLLITPLIALARQQYLLLRKQNIPVTLGAGPNGQYPAESAGVWILSPEGLQTPPKIDFAKKWRPNFLVVDECHCIWEWGDHFRPAFSQVPSYLGLFNIKQSLWLTATLPPHCRSELKRNLQPRIPIEIGSFDLPHSLFLSIYNVPLESRITHLINFISKQKEAGIIFAPTRRVAFQLTQLLLSFGKKAISYHAGLSSEERGLLELSINREEPEVVVSTSAFGMGMHFAYLKYVLLWQAPSSLLSLVQTIGRVGRSINSSGKAVVLWNQADFRLLESTFQDQPRRKQDILELLNFLNSSECHIQKLKRYFDTCIEYKKCNRCNICEPTI